mgnify:CR=1 FL=1
MTFFEEKNDFAKTYLDLMEENFQKIRNYPINTKPTYLNLSTMTMVCNLTQHIDILSFSDNFISPSEFDCIIKRPKQNTEFDITKRGKKKKTFFNQASVHYKTHTTKCIKVFSNGRLHITGVTSMIEAANVCTFTCNLLNKTSGAVKGNSKVEATDLQVCMINTNFSLNHGINIIELKKHFHQYENYSCFYTPDTYPGLKIKYHHDSTNKSSIFIFSSGQIVITGVKTIAEVKIVYSSLMDILIKTHSNIYNPHIQIKKKKNKENKTKFGYDVSIIKPCLEV